MLTPVNGPVWYFTNCAVSNLADAGVDTEMIKKIVGHSSVEMFLHYRTIKAEKLDTAIPGI